MVVAPANTEEIVAAVCDAGPWRVDGLRSKEQFRTPTCTQNHLSLRVLTGIVEHSPQDQVVVIRAGTAISDVQKALRASGETLPLPDPDEWGEALAGFPGTVGGGISMNLPHGLQDQCGSWRDWVLGMTVVRSDGTIAKCGSKAVKNVAGYDVQKLFVGARGTLCVIAEVILRTFPLRALPMPNVELLKPSPWTCGGGGCICIQRTLRTDFKEAVESAGEGLLALDAAGATLWLSSRPRRFRNDWVVFAGEGLEQGEAYHIDLMLRTKSIFDPEGKLNPGEWGAF